jgi:predicted nuclease with TOPRIM domain
MSKLQQYPQPEPDPQVTKHCLGNEREISFSRAKWRRNYIDLRLKTIPDIKQNMFLRTLVDEGRAELDNNNMELIYCLNKGHSSKDEAKRIDDLVEVIAQVDQELAQNKQELEKSNQKILHYVKKYSELGEALQLSDVDEIFNFRGRHGSLSRSNVAASKRQLQPKLSVRERKKAAENAGSLGSEARK